MTTPNPMRRIEQCLVAAALIFGCGVAQSQSNSPGNAVTAFEVGQAAHAVSPPVRDMGLAAPGLEQKREKPILSLPLAPGQEQPDPVVQTAPGPSVSTSVFLNFAGVGNGDYGFAPDAAPPDTNLSVGASQVVQWVNESFAVFDKVSGALIKGPVAGNSVFAALGGGCASNNDGDPIPQYDKIANRWILTQFSVSTTPYLQCVAVSTTSDATGPHNLYAF